MTLYELLQSVKNDVQIVSHVCGEDYLIIIYEERGNFDSSKFVQEVNAGSGLIYHDPEIYNDVNINGPDFPENIYSAVIYSKYDKNDMGDSKKYNSTFNKLGALVKKIIYAAKN